MPVLRSSICVAAAVHGVALSTNLLSNVNRFSALIFTSFCFLPSSQTSTVRSGLSSPLALR